MQTTGEVESRRRRHRRRWWFAVASPVYMWCAHKQFSLQQSIACTFLFYVVYCHAWRVCLLTIICLRCFVRNHCMVYPISAIVLTSQNAAALICNAKLPFLVDALWTLNVRTHVECIDWLEIQIEIECVTYGHMNFAFRMKCLCI